ncbi:unnamed protein product [Echinostoma caproni]|uniref:PH domain-containing protein n=1 Tax=Echinostoma caproni TaxID=27848 RepID=A0A183ALK1_9TREM|nr:unnamed protein product [Echinostoma caproni]
MGSEQGGKFPEASTGMSEVCDLQQGRKNGSSYIVYSLLIQELLAVYLQLDGFSAEQAHDWVDEVIRIAQQPQTVPEQISAWILTRYGGQTDLGPGMTTRTPTRTSATHTSPLQPSSPFQLTDDWTQVDQFASRASSATLRLMAAFAGITATAAYLNEQIRLNDQADMAALLQSKLLGRWTRNLLLVPGRRLLRYGLVYKVPLPPRAFASNTDDTLASPTNFARSTAHLCPKTPMSLDLGLLSHERNAFTISCRDVSFTVDLDDRATAETWVQSLQMAIK